MKQFLVAFALCGVLVPAYANTHGDDQDEKILRELGEQNAENTTFGTAPLGDMTENY